jgi:dolichyl-phosphate-mannose-protein mannosyltransferase
MSARRTTRIIAVLLLVAHATLFSWCAIRKSICFDEGAHVAAGVAYWRWGELSVYDLSPPLMRFWDALPAYLSHPLIPAAKSLRDDPPTSRHWNYFLRFQQDNLHAIHRYVLMGRFMQLPISLGLAIGIWLVSRRLYGDWGGIISLGVYALDPTVLANASTVGTDLGITAALFASVVLWARFLRTGTLSSLALAALCVGAAHATKFNAPLVWPVLLAMILFSKHRREGLIAFAIIAIACFAIVNLCYGFQLWGRPIGSFHFQSSLMQAVQRHLPGKFPVPLPQFMVEGFDAQKFEADGAYVSVLFGRARFGGDWRYYPWMLLCKTPMAELGLLVFALGARAPQTPVSECTHDDPDLRCASDGESGSSGVPLDPASAASSSLISKRLRPCEAPFLLLLLTIIIGMTLGTNINLGLRYLLPAYPPVIVLLSRLSRPRWAWLIVLLCVELALAAPRFHSYTNLAARNAILPDQDAGQSLIELRDWMQRQRVEQITLISGGLVDPAVYDIREKSIDDPRTQYVAIGKEFLLGVPARSSQGFVFVRHWRELQHAQPIADLGGIVIFPAEATGDDPWIRVVHSWEEAAKDPLALPIENLQDRRALNR